MGVGCGYLAPSASLVRSQGLAVLGCGSGWIPVGALAGLGGCDGCGLGFGVIGRSSARCRVRWRPLASGLFGVSSGQSLVWRPAVVAGWAGWATGLGGGATGWGVRRVVFCGALGFWGAVGAAGVGALCVRCPGPLGSCSPVCLLGALRRVCGVQGHLAPVHWCARSVCCFACAVSWAT